MQYKLSSILFKKTLRQFGLFRQICLFRQFGPLRQFRPLRQLWTVLRDR